MPFNIGPFELLLVLVLVLLIIGPGKLPEVGTAIGKSLREFRKASTDVQESLSVEPAKPAPTAPIAPATPATPATPAAESSTEVREDAAAS
jgi:TatA/E family protein of Tat protein translocase